MLRAGDLLQLENRLVKSWLPLHIIWFQGELMTTFPFLQASKLKQNHRDARSIHQEHTQILERAEDHLVRKYKTSLHSSVTELNRRTTWDGHKLKHQTQIHHIATTYTAQGGLWIKRVETKCQKKNIMLPPTREKR
jgi:hypothetical protein